MIRPADISRTPGISFSSVVPVFASQLYRETENSSGRTKFNPISGSKCTEDVDVRRGLGLPATSTNAEAGGGKSRYVTVAVCPRLSASQRTHRRCV